jgi:hypothetical protein
VRGLEEIFVEQVEFIMLDWDDKSLDGQRDELGITARTQYALADADGFVVKRWYGILDEGAVASEIEGLIAE